MIINDPIGSQAVPPSGPGFYWCRGRGTDHKQIVLVEVAENHWEELRVWCMRQDEASSPSAFFDYVRVEVPK